MRALQVLFLVIWVVMLAISWNAVGQLGIEGGNLFFADFAHPWRAQFNTDLTLHLLLFAIWVFWREGSKPIGILWALLCAFGGLFTFAYLLIAAYRAGGDARALLLGARA